MNKQSQINTAIGVVTGISALLGIFLYFDNKKHRKLQAEILEIDRNIKQIQLNELKR